MNKWWHRSAIYQIYPRSFMDSNGDGIGDILGIVSKLDYIKMLGVDAIWLSPVFASPNDDNGYDISDYRDIMPEFGTMEDMELLITESEKRGIKIIVDLVLNHTSDEHKWFVEAKSSIDNKYRDYYIWRDPVDGHEPNDIGSMFSGSAWEYDESSGQYYLHIFSKKQPDLNWENEAVRKEAIDIVNFWIDKGVGGFRLDVIELIGKMPDKNITANGPRLHDYIREINQNAFSRKDLLTVGECWCADEEIGKLYSNPTREELSMIFQFEHMTIDEQEGKGKWYLANLDFIRLKEVLNKWQKAFNGDGWNSLFWNNHDLPRIISRFGNDGEYRVLSGKMLATLLHGMKGTPYIYQGEEIGMTNVRFSSIDDYRDIEILNMYKDRISKGESHDVIMESIYAKGRDNARTPMQWNSEDYAGFSTTLPWIAVNDNYTNINVEATLADKDSIFYHYQKLVKLRKEKNVIVYGDFTMIFSNHREVFAYVRSLGEDRILVVCNFYSSNVQINIKNELKKIDIAVDKVDIILSNYNDSSVDMNNVLLRPYEAVIYELN